MADETESGMSAAEKQAKKELRDVNQELRDLRETMKSTRFRLDQLTKRKKELLEITGQSDED